MSRSGWIVGRKPRGRTRQHAVACGKATTLNALLCDICLRLPSRHPQGHLDLGPLLLLEKGRVDVLVQQRQVINAQLNTCMYVDNTWTKVAQFFPWVAYRVGKAGGGTISLHLCMCPGRLYNTSPTCMEYFRPHEAPHNTHTHINTYLIQVAVGNKKPRQQHRFQVVSTCRVTHGKQPETNGKSTPPVHTFWSAPVSKDFIYASLKVLASAQRLCTNA